MRAITPEVYMEMGLRTSEYESIVAMLGREPTYTELGMFAVMWSEHCGYKYSRPVLARFKRYREAMEGSGLENAGIVPIGDGLGVTMKVESHNHPSAVDPYQGAATGVGGIIRDILTMGARPIACLDSLRFGPVVEGSADPSVVRRNRYLFDGVVAGIAGYGNCVGVPTVGGEVEFHPRFSGNPLVNAMCVGILRLDQVTTAAAAGLGNPVIYLGSATGKDGIHGATFASDTLDETSEAKRPNVQIGDPFAEKQLIEATLEALATGAIVAIQDMGAAGITCSTVEMSSKGSVGMEIDLDLVPMRESDMTAYELMLSESQERMMAIAHLGREQEVIDVFHKWGIHAVVVGKVTDTGRVMASRFGKVEANIDPKWLTDHCPTYYTEGHASTEHIEAGRFSPTELPETSVRTALVKLLSHPNLASKRWIYEQFDHQVQTQTSVLPGKGDAAVLAPRGTAKGLAIKLDGNGRKVFLHPRRGGMLAVVEAARNVACVGGLPVAVTDGLNFGNPELPHVYWQFREAVFGIADATEVLETPVISGNVSFYNQSELGEVLPTPIIGMLGVIERAERRLTLAPSTSEAAIGMVWCPLPNDPHQGLGASLFLEAVHSMETGWPIEPNLKAEAALCRLLAELAHERSILSAHDVSDGGIAACAAEIAIESGVPLALDLEAGLQLGAFAGATRIESILFGEFPGLVLIAIEPEDVDTVSHKCAEAGLGFTLCGAQTPESEFTISAGEFGSWSWSLDLLGSSYEGSIPALMDR